jgi:dUTP pyrophosphatase
MEITVIIEFSRTRISAHEPERANASDAGLDVFYSPEQENQAIAITPGGSSIIPTGLRFGVPHGYMLEVKNRSSVAAKRSLIVGACVVDSGYDGEVFVNLHNIGKETQYVRSGDKVAQLVMIPVVNFRAVQSTTGDLYRSPITISDRGDGALGSTDENI